MSSTTSDSEEYFDTVNDLPFQQNFFKTTRTTNSLTTSPLSSPNKLPSFKDRIFQHASSHETIDDSPSARRKRLRFLRCKMMDEFEAGSEQGPSACALSLADNINALESISDISSLASWSKNLLRDENLRGSEALVVKAVDSMSTKAPFVPDQQPQVQSGCGLQVQTVKPSSTSDQQSPKAVPGPSSIFGPNLVAPSHVSSLPSSVNHSSGSSKSSTMERFITPESKTSSLDRRVGINIVRSMSKKSSSLNREIGGLSACEQLLYDNAHLAALERKNSAAAELIENLTSEFVKNAKLERNVLQKASEPVTPLAVGSACCSSSVPVIETPLGASLVSLEVPPKRKTEPDIVASNRVKDISTPEPRTNFFIESPPCKPPRRKRLLKDNTLPINTPPSILKSSTIPYHYSLPASHKSSQDSTLNFDLQQAHDSLNSTVVKNLDTGEQLPLALSDDRLPKCDPLSLHMMRLTNEIHRQSHESHPSETGSGTDDVSSLTSFGSSRNYLIQAKLKTMQYRKMLGRSLGRAVNKTVRKMKNVAEGVRYRFHTDEGNQSDEDDNSDNSKIIRVRASHKHKGPYHFEQVRLVQNLKGEHSGSVWCLKFSHCGRLLATGGQDNLIRVWVLKDAFNYFNDMRSRYNADDAIPLYEQLQKCTAGLSATAESCRSSLSGDLFPSDMASTTSSIGQDDSSSPFVSKPFCVYRGHSADVLDLSWSKNYFVLSSSMDRTVRLWHISRTECLCCFQHIDFVTAIVFLPKDDRYFLSGSLDGKLRLWHIPEKKVALWNEVEGGKLVTTLTFARNGKFAVVGTYDGRCIFYTTDQLKYHTQIDVKSGHGKNSRPHKITGLESFQDKLLVTSNDSRIRLYDLRDLSLTCKYKGYTNYSSQIRATFSHDGKFIVCGSEDKNIYIWKTTVDSDVLSLPPVRKDRNRMWESIRAHNAVVTAAIFAPRPDIIFQQIHTAKKRQAADSGNSNEKSTSVHQQTGHRDSGSTTNRPINDEFRRKLSSPFTMKRQDSVISAKQTFTGEILVSADFSGAIYVFLNKAKLKTGSSTFLLSY